MTNEYACGSDFLAKVGDAALGSCDTHEVHYKSDTKSRSTKPAASLPAGSGKFDKKTVVKQSITITASGFVFYGETETSLPQLLKKWKDGKPVECSCFHRSGDVAPYLSGNFIITEIKETHPAADDSKYDITLENDGAPTVFDESKFEPAPAEALSGDIAK